MPQVLTMTQLPEETPEQFAARLSEQMTTFFGEGPESTDVSADQTEGEEPAPPA